MRSLELVCPSGYDCTQTTSISHYTNDPIYLLGFFAFFVAVLLGLALIILAFGLAWRWTH